MCCWICALTYYMYTHVHKLYRLAEVGGFVLFRLLESLPALERSIEVLTKSTLVVHFQYHAVCS